MEPGEKIWWKCSKTGIFVYEGMCEDICYPDEMAVCSDRLNKSEKTIATVKGT